MTQRRAPRTSPATKRRHQDVLDAAARVFYEKGYAAASTHDIADRVGILKGSLYYYVSSKEELLARIIEQAHTISTHAIAESQREAANGAGRLAAIIRGHLQFYVDNREMATVYFREFRSLSPEHRGSIDRVGHTYRSLVRDVIQEGQRDGSLDPAIDAELVPAALVEMLNSLSRWFDPEGPRAAAVVIEQYVVMLTQGMCLPSYLPVEH